MTDSPEGASPSSAEGGEAGEEPDPSATPDRPGRPALLPLSSLSLLPLLEQGRAGLILGPDDVALAELWIGLGLLLAFVGGTLRTALQQFSPSRLINQLERRPGQDAKALEELEAELDEADRYVVPCSLLQYLGIGLAIYGSTLVDPESSPWPAGLMGILLALVASALLGEVLPHGVALHRAEPIVHRTLTLLRGLRILFLPVTWLVDFVTRFFVRNLLGIRKEVEDVRDQDNLADEIRAAVEDTDEGEALHDEEKDWIENIVDFQKRDVAHVMTPRTDVIALEAATPLREAMRQALASGHSRLPVYKEKLDDVVGMFYVRDAVRLAIDDDPALMEAPVGEHSREPYFVPESKKAGELLREFKAKRLHVAIVVDEYGGTAGLVSLEDIVEEIVGDISDEYDAVETSVPLKILEEGRLAEVDAKVRIDDINEALGLSLPESDEYETIGGLVLERLGKVPRPGEGLVAHDARITVLQAGPRRVERLRLQVLDRQQA
ncbi:MAG: hemolysin family protein [Planctomycetota bacterium]